MDEAILLKELLTVEAAVSVGRMSLYMLLKVIQPWEILIGSRLMTMVFNTVSKG